MKYRVLAILLLALCASTASSRVATAAQLAQRLDLRIQGYINELIHLQDVLIKGDRQAVKAYRERVATVGQQIMALPDEAFDARSSIHALVKYLLMGGQPRVGRRVLQILKRTDRPMGLLFAATAFASGRMSLAKKWLLNVNALEAPPAIAGNIALAKGLLFTHEEPKAANRFFDQALLLAPGTLVAESALRQMIAIPDLVNSGARLRYIAVRYLTRYQDSVFSAAFRRSFASAYVRLRQPSKTDSKWLVDLLRERSPRVRIGYAVEIARAAFIAGEVELVKLTREIASPDEVESSEDRERFAFYTKAAALIRGESGAKPRLLNEIDGGRLASRDVALLQASQILMQAIAKQPAPIIPEVEATDRGQVQATTPAVPERAIVKRGREVMASIDKLLEQ